MPTPTLGNLSKVSQTLLIPLYFRAMESRRPDALVRDPKAVELVGQLDYDFSGIRRRKDEQVSFLLRMRQFDRLARESLAAHPDGVIVDLGCGLDTRFERIDNGQVEWYGLDLPEVIELRKELLDETPRSHFVGCSVLDLSWMDALSDRAGRPLLFLAEAMLVYLEEADVKRLVQALTERFPGAELVCEAYAPVVIRFHPVPPDMPRPRWGLKYDRDVQSWAPGIRLLGRWCIFDEPEPRLGAFRLMRYFPFLARAVRVVHYRLGEAVGREGLKTNSRYTLPPAVRNVHTVSAASGGRSPLPNPPPGSRTHRREVGATGRSPHARQVKVVGTQTMAKGEPDVGVPDFRAAHSQRWARSSRRLCVRTYLVYLRVCLPF